VSDTKKQMSIFPKWAGFILATAFLVLSALALRFFWQWKHHGNEVAAVYGSYLGFVASSLAFIATVFYVVLTLQALKASQASLDAAHDAIELQRHTLSVTQKEIEVQQSALAAAQAANLLEREKWELQLRVEPRIWLEISDPNGFPMDFSGEENSIQRHYMSQISLYVWNPGQQSFRVVYVSLQEGSAGETIRQIIPELIVPPHEVKNLPLTAQLLKFLFLPRLPGKGFELETLKKPSIPLTVSIHFDSWMALESSPREVRRKYAIETGGGIRKLSVTLLGEA